VRVLFFGDKERGRRCLEATLGSAHEVCAVVAPAPPGGPDPAAAVTALAESAGVEVLRPPDVNAAETVERLAERAPDVGVMAGFSDLLAPETLAVAAEGVLNLHGGKLPEYRGASTLNWMVLEGETEAGVTVLFADEGIDTGDVVDSASFPVGPDDTIVDVVDRANDLFPGMLVDALDDIAAGTVTREPQSPEAGTYWHSRRPRDGVIRWRSMSAKRVHDLVRALAGPYPSAFTTHDSARLEVTETSPCSTEVRGVPGRVARGHPDGVVVVAADRGLVVERVRPESGPERAADDYFDGVGADLGRRPR
jgi:methionyl-tRNA formyltransferase